MKRRTFLGAAGFSTSGLLLPKYALAQGQRGSNELAIPELLTGELVNDRRHYRLQAQRGSMRFFADLETPTFGYNGSFLGPTLRLRDGEDVTIHVTNALGDDLQINALAFMLGLVPQAGKITRDDYILRHGGNG